MTTTWLATHLTTLDGLDGGDRCAVFLAWPQGLAAVQPLIADGLLRSIAVRKPAPAFSLFAWLNEGNILMDWLYSGLAEFATGQQRIVSHVASYADLAERIHLSRSHLSRQLRRAAAIAGTWAGLASGANRPCMGVSAGIRRRISSPTSDQARDHRRRLSQSGRGSQRLATALRHRAFSAGPSRISVTETIASATPTPSMRPSFSPNTRIATALIATS